MSFPKLLPWLRPSPAANLASRPRRRKPYRHRLEIEALEERLQPSLFSPAQTVLNFGANTSSPAVAVGDLTGNGKLDLISITDSAVYVQLLSEDFNTPIITPTSPGNFAVAVGHFTGDGKLDVVTIDRFGDLTILLGNGDGTFRAPIRIAGFPTAEAVGGRSCLAVGDFNGDGKDDIVTTAVFSDPVQGQISSVNVYLGNGDGTFQAPEFFLNSNVWDYSALAVGDFNGDGKLDIVAGTSPPPFGHSSVPYNGIIFLGDGNGGFRTQGFDPYSLGAWTITSLAVGDFNGDSKLDVALGAWSLATQDEVQVCLGNGDGTFQNPQSTAWASNSPYWLQISAADLNGRLGVVAADPDSPSPGEYVLLGNGDGSLQAPEFYSDPQVVSVAVGDINGNGNADLVIDDSTSIAVRINQYADAFQVTPSSPTATAGTPFSLTVEGVDFQGHASTDFAGTVHFTSSDPQAVLPADYTFTVADAGVHTFTVTLKSGGRQTVTVTDTRNPSITGTSDIVNSFTTSGDYQITAGPDGNIWFTNSSGNDIGRINPATGAITEFPLPTAGAGSWGITAGPDGNVWFTEFLANNVAEINPNTGKITEFPVPPDNSGFLSGLFRITAGPDGNVWFTERQDGAVAKINPATGQITEYQLADSPQGIAPGSDGNLLFTKGAGIIGRINPLTGQITQFPLNITAAELEEITAGPDGNLWFTDVGLNKIGRINPLTGAISEFPVPAGQSGGSWRLQGITAGPDGNVCFLEEDTEFKAENQIVYNAWVDEITPAGMIGAGFRLPLPLGGSFGLTLGPDRNLWISRFDSIAQLIPRITVSAGAAAQFTLNVPALAGAGTPFRLTVTARDAYGNVATGYTGTVHFTGSDPKAALPADYTFTPADSGVHTFAITLNTLGNQTISATDSASGLKVTSPAIMVVAGPATHFRVSAAAATTIAGTALILTVTALDADNNVATGYTGTVHFSSTDLKATLPAAYAFTAADQGTHKFNVTLKTAGSQTITVSGTDLPAGAVSAWRGEGNALDSVGSNNGGLQGGATFAPGEVGQAFSFNGTTAYVSVPYSPSLALNTFTVSAWVNPAIAPTTFGILGTRFGGEYTFDVKVEANKVHGDVGNGTNWINTSVDYGATLEPSTWHLVTYVIDNGAKQFLLYLDGALQTVIPFAGTPLFMTSGETLEIGASFAGEYFNGLIDEVTVYSRALGAKEVQGIYLNGSAGEFQTDAGSATVTVTPAAAKTLSLTGLPTSATAGTGISFTVTAKDAYGNVATGYTGTVHFSSTDLKAVLPANYTFTAANAGTHTFMVTFKTAGTQTLTATDTVTTTITGKATEKVVAAAATHFVITAPSTATVGVAFTITVTAEDAYGNTATGYRGTVHFTCTDPLATLPKDYTFTAISNGKHSFSVTLRTAGKQTIKVEDVIDPTIKGSATVTV